MKQMTGISVLFTFLLHCIKSFSVTVNHFVYFHVTVITVTAIVILKIFSVTQNIMYIVNLGKNTTHIVKFSFLEQRMFGYF